MITKTYLQKMFIAEGTVSSLIVLHLKIKIINFRFYSNVVCICKLEQIEIKFHTLGLDQYKI